MPQQLTCPNCRMVVNVPEYFGAAGKLCPGCQVEMTPVVDNDEDAVVAEPLEPQLMRAVEVDAAAAPPRATVVVSHAEPPKWKPTPVAQAWTTVAQGLRLQQWGVVVALIQPVAALVLYSLAIFGVVPLTATDGGYLPATRAFLILSYAVLALTGILLVAGRLCCSRVPPKTGARLSLAISCGLTAVATLTALMTSLAHLTPTDQRDLSNERVTWMATLGLWLAAEWSCLWGLARLGYFIKRPDLVRLSFVTAAAVLLNPVTVLVFIISGSIQLWPVLRIVDVVVCVLYLWLLSATRNAVRTKTPEDSSVYKV